jgi:hypothetical protein
MSLQSEHVKPEGVVACIAQKPCHCPHLGDLIDISELHDETLRKDHAALDEAAQRIKSTAVAILQFRGAGAMTRAPPTQTSGLDLLPDAWAAAAGCAAGMPTQMPPGVGGATPSMPTTRVYRRIEIYEELFDRKAASSSVYEYSGTAREQRHIAEDHQGLLQFEGPGPGADSRLRREG